MTDAANPQSEQLLWSAHPSPAINAPAIFLSVFFSILIVAVVLFLYLATPNAPGSILLLLLILVIPESFLAWKILEVRMISYELTSERLRLKRSFLSRSVDEIELYRVRDYTLRQGVVGRMFGVWDLHLATADRTHPQLTLRGIRDGERVRDIIRVQVEKLRRSRGVREIEVD